MPGWLIVAILLLMLAASAAIVVYTKHEDARREAQRRRFELRDTGERIAFAPEREPSAPQPPLEEVATFIGATPPPRDVAFDPDPPVIIPAAEEEEAPVVKGRFVHSADGEMLVTEPPFKVRDAIFSKRHGRYALGLVRRCPPWLTICPKVRLDTVLTPTKPDGRDPEDWREWRRRVRVRSIDLLLCDRRTWQPILAILIDREVTVSATTPGGGKDRIVDEVLTTVGLPFIRATGSLKEDWPAIRPYIEQAMLPSKQDGDQEVAAVEGQHWDASAAVKLLSMDDDAGWKLE